MKANVGLGVSFQLCAPKQVFILLVGRLVLPL
jgi:hypothetical protein